jgi:hypothetical protein
VARRWVSFERVRLWRCGACQGLRERQEARLVGVVIPELADGTFSRARVFLRDSTIDALAGSRPRASRFRGSGALAVSCGISRAIRADRDANFEPAARKMTGVRWSHLMH